MQVARFLAVINLHMFFLFSLAKACIQTDILCPHAHAVINVADPDLVLTGPDGSPLTPPASSWVLAPPGTMLQVKCCMGPRGLCMGNAWGGMSFALEPHRYCAGAAQERQGGCMGPHGRCIGAAWDLHGRCTGASWVAHGVAWALHGCRMHRHQVTLWQQTSRGQVVGEHSISF